MLGRMGPHTATPGAIYFPAGTPEPADVNGGRVDLDANILRELAEETGLSEKDVAIDSSWTLVSEGPRIACMKILRSPLTAAELQKDFAAFSAREDMPELAGLVAVYSLRDLDEAHMPAFTLTYLRHMLER
jgi:8-oxo-dGTP pyrophosphatase MutT (NUDIX family)